MSSSIFQPTSNFLRIIPLAIGEKSLETAHSWVYRNAISLGYNLSHCYRRQMPYRSPCTKNKQGIQRILTFPLPQQDWFLKLIFRLVNYKSSWSFQRTYVPKIHQFQTETLIWIQKSNNHPMNSWIISNFTSIEVSFPHVHRNGDQRQKLMKHKYAIWGEEQSESSIDF